MKRAIYYFGCIRETGHYLFDDQGQKIYTRVEGMADSLREGLDGPFKPGAGVPNGVIQKSEVGEWTIICWNDNSVDKRPGSHSLFIGKGMTHADLLGLAIITFPHIFARQLRTPAFADPCQTS